MLNDSHGAGDVIVVTELDGRSFPAVIDDVSACGYVWTTPLLMHLDGRRRFRFIPPERIHDAIWTFTGYRRRLCD